MLGNIVTILKKNKNILYEGKESLAKEKLVQAKLREVLACA